MAVTAFELRRGLSQQRIQPTGATPHDGDWLMVLGDDQEGRFGNLTAGDWFSLSQTVQLTGLEAIRFNMADLRVPADADVNGLAWEVAVYVGVTEKARMRGWTGRRSVADLVIDVHDQSGLQDIGIVLWLVTA
jgi:hypothetical protein